MKGVRVAKKHNRICTINISIVFASAATEFAKRSLNHKPKLLSPIRLRLILQCGKSSQHQSGISSPLVPLLPRRVRIEVLRYFTMEIAEISFALEIYRFVISGIEDYRKAGRVLKRYMAFGDGTKEVFVILREPSSQSSKIFVKRCRIRISRGDQYLTP
ncbi:hypothetical protein G7Y89_g5866 [Cudoniella acicularis]|uniref:Uncharacterized protein n=1 Tax=Cudoniella acicularis TaxID=354080 RepID=A0A8H4W3K4_9HELO|nr:hypothetical protein G7Y89_g5866 [Cudoniella acicularis]